MGYMEKLEKIDKTIKEISQKLEEANKIYESKIAEIDTAIKAHEDAIAKVVEKENELVKDNLDAKYSFNYRLLGDRDDPGPTQHYLNEKIMFKLNDIEIDYNEYKVDYEYYHDENNIVRVRDSKGNAYDLQELNIDTDEKRAYIESRLNPNKAYMLESLENYYNKILDKNPIRTAEANIGYITTKIIELDSAINKNGTAIIPRYIRNKIAERDAWQARREKLEGFIKQLKSVKKSDLSMYNIVGDVKYLYADEVKLVANAGLIKPIIETYRVYKEEIAQEQAQIDKLNEQKKKITNKYLTIQEANTIKLKEKQQQKDDKLKIFNDVMKQEVKETMKDAGM